MTQAALAVVGSIIASSLLTVGAFYLVLRLKRNRRRRSRDLRGGGNNISYPRSDASGTPYGSESSFVRYAAEKGLAPPAPAAPAPVMAGANRASLGSVQDLPREGGVAVVAGSPAPPVIGRPPGSRRGPGGSQGSNGGPSYALFPKTPSPSGRASPAGAHSREASDAPSSRYSGVGGSGPRGSAVGIGAAMTSSPRPAPSLAQWLKSGTTVSPFGPLQQRTSHAWPFDKRPQQDGGKVMQPGTGLPFRKS